MNFTSIERAERQADERKKKHNPPASELDLCDYFAAKAMQAIVSNGDVDPQKISQASYIIADAMLKARGA
jgi:hypothetical protein